MDEELLSLMILSFIVLLRVLTINIITSTICWHMYTRNFRNMILFSPYNNHKRQILLLPFKMRKLRLRETKPFAQVHTQVHEMPKPTVSVSVYKATQL